MYKYIFILLFLPCTVMADFSFYAGLSLSDEKSAKPEVDLPDPLGILRLEYETEKETVIFCEHISSFPKTEKGAGLNHCGFLLKL
jgi:hypothetical protein